METSKDLANDIFHAYMKVELTGNQLGYIKMDGKMFDTFPQFTVEDTKTELERVTSEHGFDYVFSSYEHMGTDDEGKDKKFYIIEWFRRDRGEFNAEA